MSSSTAQPLPATQARPPVEPPTEPHPIQYTQAADIPGNIGGGADFVEADDGDAESSYESGPQSETTSVSSSVYDFTYCNGRRYQSDRYKRADYFLPNDEKEQSRLDLVNHIYGLLLGGKLYTAPLDNPQNVLDVGTGTGIWAIDFADMHPGSRVLGTDINPIQPSWVPPNLTFEVDDMEEEWTFQDNQFDYIHIRGLSGSFKDWDAVLEQAYKKTTPGGYLEFQDYGCELFTSDGTRLEGLVPEHPPTTYIYHLMSAAERIGRPLVIGRGIAERMEKAGFVDVQKLTVTWPLGSWPKSKELKELGRWGRLSLLEGAYPYALLLLTREGWSQEAVRKMTDDLISSINKGRYYTQGWFVYGRKPAVGERVTKS